MRSASISDWTSVALPIIPVSSPGCCFSLLISSATFALISVQLFHSAFSTVEETTNLGMLNAKLQDSMEHMFCRIYLLYFKKSSPFFKNTMHKILILNFATFLIYCKV